MENKKLVNECNDNLTGLKKESTLKAQVRELLLRDNGATREEINKTLGISDRTTRNLIAQIGRQEPVILLEEKGYKLINPEKTISEDDEKALKHSYASLLSRSREIVKRASILKMAINKLEVKKAIEEARKNGKK